MDTPCLLPSFCTIITFKNILADKVFKKENTLIVQSEIWLSSEDSADLLNISTRMLQRLRKNHMNPYSKKIRCKCIYRLSDIEKVIAERVVNCNSQTLQEFRTNYILYHKSSDEIGRAHV